MDVDARLLRVISDYRTRRVELRVTSDQSSLVSDPLPPFPVTIRGYTVE